jgi:3-oxoacyl-(acyl-carrier-protein) synthase
MKIFITGLGQISAVGQGVSALETAWRKGAPPVPSTRMVPTAEGEKPLLAYGCAEAALPARIPEPVVRRMSRFAKMGFAAVAEAVDDAFGGPIPDGERTGLVVGTAFGAFDLANAFQKRIYLEGPIGASPSLFAGSVQNSSAAQLSMAFQIHGPTSTVMTMEQTALNALRLAHDWLAQDIVDHVVVMIGDEISNYHTYTLAHQPPSAGLDTASDAFSAVIGEGAVSFVLSREGGTGARRKYAEIAELELRAQTPPPVERAFTAAYGREGEFSRYRGWLKTPPRNHAVLYGSTLIGAAFETAIAALAVRDDGQPTACVQITDHGEAQSVVLRAAL